MDASNGPSKHTLLLMFGLPILTTAIVCSSMYVGHILTKRADARALRAATQPSIPALPLTAPATRTDISIAAPAVAAAPVAPSMTAPTPGPRNEKPEPHLVPMSAPTAAEPAVPAIPASPTPTIPAPAQSGPASKTAPVATVAPVPPAVKKPASMKPPAIPTPLLVPGKTPLKSSRAPLESKPYPQRVVQEPHSTQKSSAPVASAPAPTPVPSPSPAPAAAVVTPVQPPMPAPEKPAASVSAEQPRPQPVVVAPKPETHGDVAAVEPVRRTPVIAPAPMPAPVQPAPQATRPVAQPVAALPAPASEGRMILTSAPSQTAAAPAHPTHKGLLLGRPIREDDLSLDLLYALSTKYIEAYCSKQGQDAAEENKRWMKRWMDNVEQAMLDGDNSEQQYINRVTIAKRDCFNIEKATPEKIVEGCRILLRYRDGNFTWLSAMREALTRENLLKTLNFLNAGPKI